MSLHFAPTAELLALVRGRLGRRRMYLGAAGDATATELLEDLYRRGSEVSQVATTALLDAASTPFAWAYANLKAGAFDLAETGEQLVRRGLLIEGAIADELADRAYRFAEGLADVGAHALAAGGEGFGDMFREFWGLPPWALLAAGLVVLAGGGYLLLSPGGQALLSGGARALAAGGGDLLAGGGRALTTLALRV